MEFDSFDWKPANDRLGLLDASLSVHFSWKVLLLLLLLLVLVLRLLLVRLLLLLWYLLLPLDA